MSGRAVPQGLARVPLQALRFHTRNVRTNLGDLDELAASIRAEGVLVPLMAQRTAGGGLQLLHGHRRWAAADLAGLRSVPVVIVEHALRDDEAILLMLAEDKKQAVDLADRRRAIRTLRSEFDYDTATLTERLGLPADGLDTWLAGTSPARAAVPRAARPYRKPAPRVKPTQLHAVLTAWHGRAPEGLLNELRDLLGGWTPAPADVAPLPDPCSPTGA